MDIAEKQKPNIDKRFLAEGCDIGLSENGEPFVTLFNTKFGVGMTCKLSVLDKLVNVHAKEILNKLEIDRKLKEIKA